jgi:hypothetical protein
MHFNVYDVFYSQCLHNMFRSLLGASSRYIIIIIVIVIIIITMIQMYDVVSSVAVTP